MKFVPGLVTTAIVSLSVCAPGRAADDVASVQAHLQSAAAGATSFVMQLHMTGTTGLDQTITFVRPLMLKSEMRMGQMTVETYLVNNMLYIHMPLGGWQKLTLDPALTAQQSMNVGETIKATAAKLLPDRLANGSMVGVIEVNTTLAVTATPMMQQIAQHIVCTYDKTTYLMRTCENSAMTMTYSKYNDATNVIVLPPEAKTATFPIIGTPMRGGAPPAAGAPNTRSASPSPLPAPSGSAAASSPAPAMTPPLSVDSPAPTASP